MKSPSIITRTLALLGLVASAASAQEATITVNAAQVLHRITPQYSGACIEDVNHEVYGGIDSQMIFGENFAEAAEVADFRIYRGTWLPQADGSVLSLSDGGSKLVSVGPQYGDAEVSVELMFNKADEGSAGLILKVNRASTEAHRFHGYGIVLRPTGELVLGRNPQNWQELQRVPCAVPLKQWVTLTAKTTGNTLSISVNGKSLLEYDDKQPMFAEGTVGLRNWGQDVRFRNLVVTAGGVRKDFPFAYAGQGGAVAQVSGQWRAIQRGTAEGKFTLEKRQPFLGVQSQKITFAAGSGEVGIENQSLNRWGMNFVAGKPYEGYVWVRPETAVDLSVALESRDGAAVYAKKTFALKAGDWQRVDFTLEPNAADKAGRFAISLGRPGSVALGYALLQPGEWGRFKGLPVRKDVVDGLLDQGVSFLRYGGSMINVADYRWKNMTGPRASRASYPGQWYPHASNGWAVFDFLNLCEAAGFAAIPNLSIEETPEDMADFMDYLNGPAESFWGARRVADGHPEPYHLKYLELGNEERVDEDYYRKFQAIAAAIWAKDPAIILVVGDFSYEKPIDDPFAFTGAHSGITSLAAHQQILQLAKQHDREVWFDIHTWTDGPRPNGTLPVSFTYIDALQKLAEGAKHQVVVFELNANNHLHRRALANAIAINTYQRDGRMRMVGSANCLQPDGQNDNNWDQGMLFLTPSQVWLQSPGYVTQMFSRNYQPLVVQSSVSGGDLDVTVTKSEDGQSLVLQVVNAGGKAATARLNIAGFTPQQAVAQVQTLAGTLAAKNPADRPDTIKPVTVAWPHGLKDGATAVTFPARSFTVIKL